MDATPSAPCSALCYALTNGTSALCSPPDRRSAIYRISIGGLNLFWIEGIGSPQPRWMDTLTDDWTYDFGYPQNGEIANTA